MGGADLRADARFALRSYGVEKADDIHAAGIVYFRRE